MKSLRVNYRTVETVGEGESMEAAVKNRAAYVMAESVSHAEAKLKAHVKKNKLGQYDEMTSFQEADAEIVI